MICNNIEFHNVAEITTREGYAGQFLYRYPAEARRAMIPLGQVAATMAADVELRFACDCDWATLTLSDHGELPWQSEGTVDVFRGDFFCARHRVQSGHQITINLVTPPQLHDLTDAAFAGAHFSPAIWRIALAGGTFIFHELNSLGQAVRPPRPDEKPRLRWLAYGPSITNVAPDGYPARTALFLGVDVLNKGLTGSCFFENETAQHLATGETWDFATLELGVNVRHEYSESRFAQRAGEFLSILRNAHPTKPIALITVLPNVEDYRKTPTMLTERNRQYRHVLRHMVATSNDPNLHLIEGDQIMPRYTTMSQDMVHPAPFGHTLIARHLADHLHQIIKTL